MRLPIFEDGMETTEYLEIDITYFISDVRGLRSSQARVVETLADWEKELLQSAKDHEDKLQEIFRTPEEEVDTLDRIVHDLPPLTDLSGRTVKYKKQRIHEDPEERPELPIGATFDAREERGWRAIPEFKDYFMNNHSKIINVHTQQEVPVTLGRINNVLLSDEDGVARRMSVNHLFKKTFPELAHPGLPY